MRTVVRMEKSDIRERFLFFMNLMNIACIWLDVTM